MIIVIIISAAVIIIIVIIIVASAVAIIIVIIRTPIEEVARALADLDPGPIAVVGIRDLGFGFKDTARGRVIDDFERLTVHGRLDLDLGKAALHFDKVKAAGLVLAHQLVDHGLCKAWPRGQQARSGGYQDNRFHHAYSFGMNPRGNVPPGPSKGAHPTGSVNGLTV